jgi:hypothetical protein
MRNCLDKIQLRASTYLTSCNEQSMMPILLAQQLGMQLKISRLRVNSLLGYY